MLTTILINLKALQNGYVKSSQTLEQQLKSLQDALTEEQQKRESLETSIEQLNSTVISLIDCLKTTEEGIN